jgi:hypothetical protein
VESAADGRLTMENTGAVPLNHLFLLRVENGRGTYQYFPALPPGQKTRAQIDGQ